MKKSKAQHALLHPYHVQNLLRAMAARVSRTPANAVPPSSTTAPAVAASAAVGKVAGRK